MERRRFGHSLNCLREWPWVVEHVARSVSLIACIVLAQGTSHVDDFRASMRIWGRHRLNLGAGIAHTDFLSTSTSHYAKSLSARLLCPLSRACLLSPSRLIPIATIFVPCARPTSRIVFEEILGNSVDNTAIYTHATIMKTESLSRSRRLSIVHWRGTSRHIWTNNWNAIFHRLRNNRQNPTY